MFCSYSAPAQNTCGQVLGLKINLELTKLYIASNHLFPLTPELISLSLAAKIAAEGLDTSGRLDFDKVGIALNSMHSKYRVPVRFLINGLQLEPRQIPVSQSRLREVVAEVVKSAEAGLQVFEGVDLNRRKAFWTSINQFFKSKDLKNYSENFKQSLVQGVGIYSTDRLKQDAFYDVSNLLIQHLYKDVGIRSNEWDLMDRSRLFSSRSGL